MGKRMLISTPKKAYCLLFLLMWLILFTTGCVPKNEYDNLANQVSLLENNGLNP
jgi:hypothetical protein